MFAVILPKAIIKMNLTTLLWGWKKRLQGQKRKKNEFLYFF